MRGGNCYNLTLTKQIIINGSRKPRTGMNMTTKLSRIIWPTLVLCVATMLCKGQPTLNNPVIPGTGGNTLLYHYSSPLKPTLDIYSVGGGSYTYSIGFNNTDTSPIWNFEVFSKSPATALSGTFTYVWDDLVTGVYPEYDPRNLDASLTDTIHMNYPSPFGTAGLAVGGYGGISFTLNAYYSSFLYAYETVASGYTQSNGDGYHAAVGVVLVPEPSSFILIILGAAGLMIFRRRR
jgi:hypothetical protein